LVALEKLLILPKMMVQEYMLAMARTTSTAIATGPLFDSISSNALEPALATGKGAVVTGGSV